MDKSELLKRANDALLLMKRMGEAVDTSTISFLKENLSPSVMISEGLIKSYDAESVVSFIAKAFGFKNQESDTKLIDRLYLDIGKNITYNGKIWKSGNDTIAVMYNPSEYDVHSKLDFYFKKYGYILSRIDDNQDEQKTFYYEKKFPESIMLFQLVRDVHYMYHVTEAKNRDLILKKGLRARSSSNENGFMHDERIYLFLEYPDSDWVNFLGFGNPLVIKVDITKLPDTYKFYFGPRVDGGLYTFENIPPEALEIQD